MSYSSNSILSRQSYRCKYIHNVILELSTYESVRSESFDYILLKYRTVDGNICTGLCFSYTRTFTCCTVAKSIKCIGTVFCLTQAESLQAECDFTKEQVAAMKGEGHVTDNFKVILII